MQKLATVFAVAGLAALSAAQASTPIPATFREFGSSCGSTLTAVDKIAGGFHQVTFQATAPPRSNSVLMIGLQQPLGLIPGTACPLWVWPLVSLPMAATGSSLPGTQVEVHSVRVVLQGDSIGAMDYQSIWLDPGFPVLGASGGLAATFEGLMTIDSVSPTSVGEGDLITIRGSGFDPNAANHRLLLGGVTVATVETAAPTVLVARVNAVPALTVGDCVLLRGTGASLPTGPMTMAGHRVVVHRADHLAGNSMLDAGVAARVGPPTPGLRTGVAGPTSIAFASNSAPLVPGTVRTLVLHVADPALPPPESNDLLLEIEPAGRLSAAEADAVFAAYVDRFVPDIDASAKGSGLTLTPTRGGVVAGRGVISERPAGL